MTVARLKEIRFQYDVNSLFSKAEACSDNVEHSNYLMTEQVRRTRSLCHLMATGAGLETSCVCSEVYGIDWWSTGSWQW